MENNHVHKFEATKIPATCKERGYTLYKCDCGYEHKEDFTPLGQHNYVKSEEKQPTCTEDGFLKYTCEFCGECSTSVIPKKGHYWGPWQVQKIATCTEEGSQYRICQVCGCKENAVIPAKGHDLKKEGKTYFCRNCGETIEKPSFFKKHKKAMIISGISIIMAVLIAGLVFAMPHIESFSNKKACYDAAKNFLAQEDYTNAYINLLKCDGYSDSKELLKGIEVIGYETKTEMIYRNDVFEILCKYEYTYDKNGNVLGYNQYLGDGSHLDKLENTYDENNNMTSSICYIYGKQVFDTDTGIVTYRKLNSPEIKYKKEYTYDKNGNLLTEIEYDADNSITHTNEKTYDENGNLLTEIKYDADNNTTQKYEKTYDDKGNVLTVTVDGKLTTKRWYFYDEDGKKIREYIFNVGSERQIRYVYTYNEKGLLVLKERKCVFLSADDIIDLTAYDAAYDGFDNGFGEIIKYRYDEQYRILSEIEYDDKSNEIEYKYEYTYDKFGYSCKWFLGEKVKSEDIYENPICVKKTDK